MTLVVCPVPPVFPTAALVCAPSGWAEPVPVVKCVFWIRPMRSPSLRASHDSRSNALSWRSWRLTRTSFDVYMNAPMSACPIVTSCSVTWEFSARIAPTFAVSSFVGHGSVAPV